MCRSVPQTPQAPTVNSAAFDGTVGRGTVRMSGDVPGPANVATRTCCIVRPRFFLPTGRGGDAPPLTASFGGLLQAPGVAQKRVIGHGFDGREVLVRDELGPR